MATVYATLTGTSTELTVGLSGATSYRWEASADVIFSSITIVDIDATFNYSNYTTTTYIRPVVTDGTNTYDDIAVIKVYLASGATRIDITFGSQVESIGQYAFYNCASLAILTIGDSVTSIGTQAFANCTSLATLIIGDSVTSIGNYAFASCISLATLTIGTSVTSIGTEAFYNCQSLATLTIGNSVTSIGQGAFAYCESLATITVSSGNTTFFTDSRGILYQITDTPNNYVTAVLCPPATTITNITIDTVNGYTVTSIGQYAFTGCTSLATIDLGSVTSIGQYAFYNCDNLATIDFGDSVTSIGDYAFENCTSLATIDFGSVTSIGEYAFQSCTSLATIDFGSVTEIGQGAFQNCDSLATIDFGSVTSIGNNAFYSCESLATVVIGDSVTSIGQDAFTDCNSLATITVSSDNTTFFTDVKSILYQITNTTNNYVTAVLCPPAKTTNKNITIDTVNSYTVTSIGDAAFHNCTSLETVTIGNSVTSIGISAFYGCTSLASLVIGNSVTSIGQQAFAYCKSLANIYFLGAKPSSIGSNNFQSKLGDTAYYRATYDSTWSSATISNISYLRHIPTISTITATTITGSRDSTLTAVLVYISSDDGLSWTTSTITNSSTESWSLSYTFETGKTYKVSTIANYYNATTDYEIYCKTPDLQSPTLQITSDKSLIKSGETATLTFTFSETVTGFDSSDITTTNGTLSNFAGSGTTYTAIFTPTANVEGTATINIAANKFSDAAGNPNTATSLSITVDTLAPNTPAVTGTSSNTISGTAEAGSTLVATNTKNATESVSVDNTGKWRLKVASLDSYVFRARDTAGNVSNPTTFSSNSFSFRYSGSSIPFRFTAGAPIKSIGMSSAGRISGDTSTSFKIKPALPPGLSFSRRTGKISGTPLAPLAATKYTITSVSTVYASRSAKITIEVL